MTQRRDLFSHYESFLEDTKGGFVKGQFWRMCPSVVPFFVPSFPVLGSRNTVLFVPSFQFGCPGTSVKTALLETTLLETTLLRTVSRKFLTKLPTLNCMQKPRKFHSRVKSVSTTPKNGPIHQSLADRFLNSPPSIVNLSVFPEKEAKSRIDRAPRRVHKRVRG